MRAEAAGIDESAGAALGGEHQAERNMADTVRRVRPVDPWLRTVEAPQRRLPPGVRLVRPEDWPGVEPADDGGT